MDCIDDFRFSEANVAKWERKCQSLGNEDASSVNDIHHKIEFETMDRIEKVPADHINSQHTIDVMLLQYNTNEYQISHPELPGVTHYGSYLNMDTSNLPLGTNPLSHLSGNWFGKDYSGNGNYCTQENYQLCQDKKQIEGSYSSRGVVKMTSSHSSDGSGSVHSGAPPPWLDANDRNVSNVQLNLSDMTSFLATIPGKNRKLHPKRVGAAWAERRKIEIEMEKRGHATNSNIGADWLPNFGRVWQSGTQKESRKEFEKEKWKLVKPENISAESEPIQIQPYISKRVRRESDE